jgi:predicted dehydrogenase
MTLSQKTRREFLRASVTPLAGTALAPYLTAAAAEPARRARGHRFRLAAVGMRYQGSVITQKALAHGDLVAVCDVDRHVAEQAKASFGSTAALYEDYRKMLDRKDVEVVLIGAPDHWHTAMALAACRAGKDVYCEKPLTLTVDEGKLLCKVVKETKRAFQVGTWQRSDVNFRLACELVRAGRLGKLRKVTVMLDKNPTGGPFRATPPPANLNWDLWQGQAPAAPYAAERCHYTFRWWQEYSGGKVTDWGAHHLDVAQWAMGVQLSGPLEVEGTATFPKVENGYNVPGAYRARLVYPGGVEMTVLDGPAGARPSSGSRGARVRSPSAAGRSPAPRRRPCATTRCRATSSGCTPTTTRTPRTAPASWRHWSTTWTTSSPA